MAKRSETQRVIDELDSEIAKLTDVRNRLVAARHRANTQPDVAVDPDKPKRTRRARTTKPADVPPGVRSELEG